MIAYTVIETSDLDSATEFYDAVFNFMGVKPMRSREWPRAYAMSRGSPAFVLRESASKYENAKGKNAIIFLQCANETELEAVYAKALMMGGKPGSAPTYQDGDVLTAWFHDLDGHKIGLRAQQKALLSIPKILRRGSRQEDDRASIGSGIKLVDLIERYKTLDDAVILDFGCGAKIAQALHQLGDPQDIYYGLDVYSELINYLQDSLSHNPAYDFAVVPFHNDMYNPAGEKMTGGSALPIPDIQADIITMFSVVTHLNPEDCLAVLSLLKRYAKPETRLIFSTFLDADQTDDFVDEDPKRPLLVAKYRPDFMRKMIEDAGWKILEENPPFRKIIQHHFVCKLS